MAMGLARRMLATVIPYQTNPFEAFEPGFMTPTNPQASFSSIPPVTIHYDCDMPWNGSAGKNGQEQPSESRCRIARQRVEEVGENSAQA